MTESDGKEWLKARWTWEGLTRSKQIETSSTIDVGIYDHPIPVTEWERVSQQDRDSPQRQVVTGVTYKQVHDIPFTRENFEKEISKRSAPKDEKHIVMTLQKIDVSGIRYPHVYQVTDKEQYLTRPFNELWDYLASSPLKEPLKQKWVGKTLTKRIINMVRVAPAATATDKPPLYGAD